MKKGNVIVLSVAALAMMFSAQSAWTAGGHEHGHDDGKHHQKDHGHEHGHGMPGMNMDAMFLKKKVIDGYTVSFHVMQAQEGMRHGGSHNFMVKVEKDGAVLNDIKVNSKVVHPNGQSETKMLMKMGDWYMAGYDLGHDGRHQLMILFKTADGSKHRGGVYYP